MSKQPSPLIGYNHNFRHRGRVVHVQTEDSGVKYPHVITHLYADGGRIVKSLKTSYAEQVGKATMADSVRELMRTQHKAMIVALRDGQFDDMLEGIERASAAPPAEPAPEWPKEPTSRRVSAGAMALARMVATAAGVDTEPPPATDREPLDTDAPPSNSLPPPPEHLFQEQEIAPPSKGPRPREPRRYAAARPPAIFAPPPPTRPDFGSSLISERSLDDVILSYLTEAEPGTSGRDGG